MDSTYDNIDFSKLGERIKNIRKERWQQYKEYEAKKQYIIKNTSIIPKYAPETGNISDSVQYAQDLYSKYKVCKSQETLADAIDVGRQTINKWEKGEAKPKLEHLFRLCSIFNCSMDYLLGTIEIPLQEDLSIAHFITGISPEILKYAKEHEDYLDCLNFFMLPENCKSLFNYSTLSKWREFWKDIGLSEIKDPLKEAVKKAYDKFCATIPIQHMNIHSYEDFLRRELPIEAINFTKKKYDNKIRINFTKKNYDDRIRIKDCLPLDTYMSLFNDNKDFDYSAFIRYLSNKTYDPLSYNTLIEAQKIKLANSFITLFEKYLES